MYFILLTICLKLCLSIYTSEPPVKFLEVQSLSDRYPASQSDYRINCTNGHVSKIKKQNTMKIIDSKFQFIYNKSPPG